MNETRVLLVEDDDLTRAHIAELISRCEGLHLAGDAATCSEARRLMAELSPDLLVTDLGLPDGNGFELIRLARTSLPECQIMVITVFGDESNVIHALEEGADGYLLKDATQDEISRGLRELVEGGSPMSAPIARHLLRRFRRGIAHEADEPPPSPEITLADRELEVLQLLAKGFSYNEIAELLGISRNTVATYVRRIYDKLDVRSKSAAVYEAVNLGIIRMNE